MSSVAYVRSLGVGDLKDLRSWAASSSFSDFKGQIRGQWFTMRLGVETVKPDVHIIRFVPTAIGRSVSKREAVDGLVHAASVMGIKANLLDWSRWEFQRFPMTSPPIRLHVHYLEPKPGATPWSSLRPSSRS